MAIFWRCIVIFTAITTVVSQKKCPLQEAILPCQCQVRGEEYQIWCSHSDLTSVLEGLRSVGQLIFDPIDELILENNFLPSLPGRTYIPLKVMRLMLRYNGLERVSRDWLVGLEHSLMELFIVEPNLRSLPDDSLMRLENLEAVTIQSNFIKRLPLFSNLRKLQYLQIESLSLIELTPRNFENLPNLNKIHISNSPRLTRLEAGLLQDLPRLTMVNISYCGINWMHPRAITRLPHLKELSLTGNKIVDVGMVGRASRDLPSLEILRLDHNYIDKIGEAAFVDLPQLKKIFLANNHIVELQYGAFHRVPLLRSLDLNNNNVRRVHPESFLQHSGSGLEELSLVNNDIDHVIELRSLLDALPRLTFLELSYNNLEAIPFGSLRGHATLEILHLDYNKIHLIDREAIMAMPALRELRLKNNSLSELLDGPLWNLPALKGLDLSGNLFRSFETRFLANLPALRKINLSQNQLTVIEPNTFVMTPELEHVNLSWNALSSLHPATFRHLEKLYELDVSHNLLPEFVPALPRGIEYIHMSYNQIGSIPIVPSPDLNLPSLRMLDLSGNLIQRLPPNSLQSLSQLRRLYLGDNALQRLDEFSIGHLAQLEVLDLKNNRITNIHPKSLQLPELRYFNFKNNRIDVLFPEIFKYIQQLRKLDISKNQLVEILPATMENNQQIQIIDASHNALVQLPASLFGLKSLRKLDLTNNRLKTLQSDILNSLISLEELKLSGNYIDELKMGVFDNLRHLKILTLDNNDLELIETNAIRSLPVLKAVNMGWNKLKNIPNSAFNNLPALETVELQNNQITQIDIDAFHLIPHLVVLNLSYNSLPNLNEVGLAGLKSLEMLDVSYNRISRIVGKNLEKMEFLVELRLDDNIICGIYGTPFNGMPRLRVLSLNNNKLTNIPEKVFEKIKNNLGVLNVDGNPLICSCNLLWLQAWLQEVSTIGPKCADGTFLREMRLIRQNCPEKNNQGNMEAPGCESELLSAPGHFDTSQIFSHWMKLKNNNTSALSLQKGHKNNLAPLPEESEYFYDEYVDYPYNETIQHEPLNIVDNNIKHTFNTTKSPHYISGDTPTIYAAPKNKTMLDIPKEVINSPSTSGFTFFGVPLPSINLNNLWGNNRSDRTLTAQRKTAIINNSPTSKNLRPSMVPLGPPDSPKIQIGGFKPLLPGSGGFKPISNPNLDIPQTDGSNISPTTVPEKENTDYNLFGGHPVPTPTSSITTTSISVIKILKQPKEDVLESSVNEKMQPVTTEKLPDVTSEKDVVSTIQRIELTTNIGYISHLAKQDNLSIISDKTSEVTTIQPPITSTERIEITIASSTSIHTSTQMKDDQHNKTQATPLSALLIPGGQQPDVRPTGRPTITKITPPQMSSSQLLLSSAEVHSVPDPLPHRESKNTVEQLSSDKNIIETANDDMNWYFANYNKTNLEPFVGNSDLVNGNVKFDKKYFLGLVLVLIIFNFYPL